MLYVIDTVQNLDKTKSLVIFEANTESTFRCTKEFLKDIMHKQKIEIKNAELVQNDISIKQWKNELHFEGLHGSTGAEHIVLGKCTDTTFKIVRYTGNIWYCTEVELIKLIKEDRVYNVTIENDKYKLTCTYNATTNTEFIKSIAEKYEKYVALTIMLGNKTEFEYTVEGQIVRLTSYISKNNSIIIPNFITAIKKHAFLNKGITSVTLGNGIGHIGDGAFEDCKISEVIIPEQVKIIGPSAFRGNRKLITNNGEFTEKVTILGESTLVIQRYNMDQEDSNIRLW